jgi:ribonuclease HII
VLGPLVFGACLVTESDEPRLRELGAADSKQLSPKRRDAVRSALHSAPWILGLRTLAIEPAAIDERSLSVLGAEAIVSLAAALRPDVLVLDAPVAPPGIPAFAAEIRDRLRPHGLADVEIVAENQADERHACVSAASVLAKTTRDMQLSEIEAQSGSVLGSGYPSDPATVAFLRAAWTRDGRFPPFVRTKWETVRRIVAEGAQGRLFS